MEKKKKILWTLLLTPGMGLLGIVTCAFLPVVPQLSGIVFALLMIVALMVGMTSALCAAAGYCAGVALMCLVLEPQLLPVALWLLALLAAAMGVACMLLRKKTALVQVMLYTGIAVFSIGALTYIACNLILGDVVALMVDKLKATLAQMQETMPQLMDMLLSQMSASGVLPDVGLESMMLELEEQTRRVLVEAFLESFDVSLRLQLIDLLVRHCMQMAFLGILVPLMLLARKGEGERFSVLPDLTLVRVPNRFSLISLAVMLVLWVWMMFSSSAYAVYVAGWSAFQFLYAVQGLSVSEWFLKKHGWSSLARRLLMGAIYLFLPGVLFLIGFLEQIFLFRKIGRPKPEDFGLHGRDDDDENP